LSSKTLTPNNKELWVRLRNWNRIYQDRITIEDRLVAKEKKINEALTNYKKTISLGKENIFATQLHFAIFKRSRRTNEDFETTINRFLLECPSHQAVIQYHHVWSTYQTYANRVTEGNKLLGKVVEQICKECKMAGQRFSFYDIPDLLVKREMKKHELQLCIDFISDAKEHY